MARNLFDYGSFISHSGKELNWKIECEALNDDDWNCLAHMILEFNSIPFQYAIGIPRGGVKLGDILDKYGTRNENDPVLIVDDVMTTGNSFEEFKQRHIALRAKEHRYMGWCVFSRSPLVNDDDTWIRALFTMPGPLDEVIDVTNRSFI